MPVQALMNLVIERQCFHEKAESNAYESLFRHMQPVRPVYWSCPGDPPRIVHRTGFADAQLNFDLRADRILVKGRFQNGTIAYIYADELELFAGAYRKPLPYLSFEEQVVYDMLDREGPLTIQILKEMTGMLVKLITPILHKFQEAFLIFEDQADNEWDRGWYLFEKEFPEVNLDRYSRAEALEVLIPRFLYLNVFATVDMLRSFYGLPQKPIKDAIARLLEKGAIAPSDRDGNVGYIRTEDLAAIAEKEGLPPVSSVFVLHMNDFLVKSNQVSLKAAFSGGDFDILFYILVDGRFRGVVQGVFRNGPFDLEDVSLTLSDEDKAKRKGEIIEAIYEATGHDASRLKRYCGVPEAEM